MIEIDTNASSALDNTKKAEQQIVEAAAKQKGASKCMLWLIGIITVSVLIIILCVIMSLVWEQVSESNDLSWIEIDVNIKTLFYVLLYSDLLVWSNLIKSIKITIYY